LKTQRKRRWLLVIVPILVVWVSLNIYNRRVEADWRGLKRPGGSDACQRASLLQQRNAQGVPVPADIRKMANAQCAQRSNPAGQAKVELQTRVWTGNPARPCNRLGDRWKQHKLSASDQLLVAQCIGDWVMGTQALAYRPPACWKAEALRQKNDEGSAFTTARDECTRKLQAPQPFKWTPLKIVVVLLFWSPVLLIGLGIVLWPVFGSLITLFGPRGSSDNSTYTTSMPDRQGRPFWHQDYNKP
jgi:hypothetical protein